MEPAPAAAEPPKVELSELMKVAMATDAQTQAILKDVYDRLERLDRWIAHIHAHMTGEAECVEGGKAVEGRQEVSQMR